MGGTKQGLEPTARTPGNLDNKAAADAHIKLEAGAYRRSGSPRSVPSARITRDIRALSVAKLRQAQP